MAVYSGPEIVNNGLVLHLDAANSRSYPGSGTVWYDLSGRGNNGTLVNGVSYNSGNNGGMVFDGTNDHVYYSNFNPSIFSCEVWFNGTAGYVLRKFNYGWGLYYQSPTSLAAWVDTDTNHRSTTQTFSTNGTTCVALVFANSQFTIYRNGTQVAQVTTTGSTVYSVDTTFRLATDAGSNSFLLGNIFSLKVYDRGLSATEIKQNFEATRTRYGV